MPDDRKPMQFKTTPEDRENLEIIRAWLEQTHERPTTIADAFRDAIRHRARTITAGEKKSKKSPR